MAGYAPKIALGLGLRHDWGPQYTAHQFRGELQWLGIRSTAAYVGEPECPTRDWPLRRLQQPRVSGSLSAMDTGPWSRSARSSLARRQD